MYVHLCENKKSRIYGTSDQSISFAQCESPICEAVGGQIQPPTSASHFGLPLRPPTSASHFGLPLWPPTLASHSLPIWPLTRPPNLASHGLSIWPLTWPLTWPFTRPLTRPRGARPPMDSHTASQCSLPHSLSLGLREHGLPHGLPWPPNVASHTASHTASHSASGSMASHCLSIWPLTFGLSIWPLTWEAACKAMGVRIGRVYGKLCGSLWEAVLPEAE